MKRNIKLAITLIFGIVVTLGLTISLQSILAAWWTAPSSPPPDNGISKIPIYASSSAMQIITGTTSAGDDVLMTGDLQVNLTFSIGPVLNAAGILVVSSTTSERKVTINASSTPSLTILNSLAANSDSQILFQLEGTPYFSMGVDDSNYDSFNISRSNVLGTNDALVANSTGTIDVLYNGVNGNFPTQLNILNTYTGSPQDAQIRFGFGSDAAGPDILFTIGIDESDGGKFKISSSTTLGTNDRFIIDGNGNFGIGADPNGSKGQGGYISVKDIYFRDSGKWGSNPSLSTCTWSGWSPSWSCPADQCNAGCICGCPSAYSQVLQFNCSGGFLTDVRFQSCYYSTCDTSSCFYGP